MKAFLLYPDRDFDENQQPPPNADALIQDLGLDVLFDAMALGDEFLRQLAKRAVLSSLEDPAAIIYRQRVLDDCLRNPSRLRGMYDLTVEAVEGQKRVGGFLWGGNAELDPVSVVEALQFFVGMLKRLREIADEQVRDFASDGFTRFFEMLRTELDDEYFRAIEEHLKTLRFRRGVLIGAELGKGNKGRDYVLRRPRQVKRTLVQHLSARNRANSYTLTIPDRDEAGANALSELRGKGVNLIANALAQSVDHIGSFFTMLRRELGFYLGCLNLHDRLTSQGELTCFAVPLPAGEVALSARGLYDAGLSLSMRDRVVGNDIDADGKSLVMVTGANQGGKSTFLRSLGLAHLMMQCGLFVPAESFRANVCRGLFTHYKHEEDAGMESGKLDEELARMSEIVDHVRGASLVLFNESFAATNEREGSEIARQVVGALLEAGVKVCFVTHFFDLSASFHRRQLTTALFLRAERESEGRRTFHLPPGEPLPTSYGEDIYNEVFEPCREGA